MPLVELDAAAAAAAAASHSLPPRAATTTSTITTCPHCSRSLDQPPPLPRRKTSSAAAATATAPTPTPGSPPPGTAVGAAVAAEQHAARNPFYEVSNEYMRVSGYYAATPLMKLLHKARKRPHHQAGGREGGTPSTSLDASPPVLLDNDVKPIFDNGGGGDSFHHNHTQVDSGEKEGGAKPCYVVVDLLPHSQSDVTLSPPADMAPAPFSSSSLSLSLIKSMPEMVDLEKQQQQQQQQQHQQFLKSPAALGADSDENSPSGQRGSGSVAGSPYGMLWKVPPNFKRIKKRKQLFVLKTRACNISLIFALAGIACAILEAELVANQLATRDDMTSQFLRTVITFTTLILMGLVFWYHVIEIQITLIDSGAYDWQVTVTSSRISQLCIELLICAIAPFPSNFLFLSHHVIAGGLQLLPRFLNRIYVPWLILNEHHLKVRTEYVSLDTILVLPMFLRFYLLCRYMALQSKQFQDAATRSIASLNRVAVNFTFVFKTLMFEHPIYVLCSFTLTFWVLTAWMFMHCERQTGIDQDNTYLNAIWFIMITFKSVGYGDIVPYTYCGRALAVTAGIVGAAVSSALIAVISHKLELSRAEKHVNNFMADSKLTHMRKHTAAMVLQHTWFIHKYGDLQSTKDQMKLRFHQRRFLAAINELGRFEIMSWVEVKFWEGVGTEQRISLKDLIFQSNISLNERISKFRKVKWDQRKLAEQGNQLVDLAKLQNDTYTMIYRMQQSLDRLNSQIERMNADNDLRQSAKNMAAVSSSNVSH